MVMKIARFASGAFSTFDLPVAGEEMMDSLLLSPSVNVPRIWDACVLALIRRLGGLWLEGGAVCDVRCSPGAGPVVMRAECRDDCDRTLGAIELRRTPDGLRIVGTA